VSVCNFDIFVIQVKLNGINMSAEVTNKKDNINTRRENGIK